MRGRQHNVKRDGHVKFPPLQTILVMFGGAVTRVRHLVGLNHESEGVTREKRQHDGHENHRRLFATLSKVLRRVCHGRDGRGQRGGRGRGQGQR